MATDPVEHDNVKKEGGEVNVPEVEWTPENEINLFKAMNGRRPVGSQRFFHMYFIVDKFSELMQREISSQAIWDHLDEMYDMEALNENTPLPKEFASESEFKLPLEYEELKEKLVIEDSLSTSSVADSKEEKDKSSETEAPKSVSSVKSESSSTKVPKVKTEKETPKAKPDKDTPKEPSATDKESESKVSGDQETPKPKKARPSRSDSLIKTASNNSSNKKRRINN